MSRVSRSIQALPILFGVLSLILGACSGQPAEVAGSIKPLMVAAGMTRLVDFTASEQVSHLEAVKLALELGAKIDEANKQGETPLHAAASAGAGRAAVAAPDCPAARAQIGRAHV